MCRSAVQLGIVAALALPLAGCVTSGALAPPVETAAGVGSGGQPFASQATPSPGPGSPGPAVPVPHSIDGTGVTDAADALSAFISSVPDGSTIVFPAAAVYRISHGLHLLGRNDLIFDGNGTTLEATAASGEIGDSPFFLERSAGITIRDLTLTGNNPDVGTPASHHRDRQDQGGVMVYGGERILIEDTTIRGVWGDCVYIDASAGAWAQGIVYRDSVCLDNGRQGVAVIAARSVLVERVDFNRISLSVLDIEPNYASEGAIGVDFRDNTVGTYGLSNVSSGYFFAADGAQGSTVRNVTITGNTVTGGTLLTSVVVGGRQNITMTDNTSLVPARGPVLRFSGVDGLTVSGNVQPLSSGTLLALNEPVGGTRTRLALLGALLVLGIGAGGVIVWRRRRRA